MASPEPPALRPQGGTFTPPPWRWISTKRDIDRTRNGLIIVAAAALCGIVPLVGAIPYFVLGLVGAVLVFSARFSFDPQHRSNVKASLIAWTVAFIVGVVGGALAVVLILMAAPRGSFALQAAWSTAVDIILATTIASTFLYGLAWVLLPYSLSTREGRVFLWSAFGIDWVASFALAFAFRDELIAAMQEATTGGMAGLDPFGGTPGSLQFFSFASAGLYAIAYLYASFRVGRGEVSPYTSLSASTPP